MMGDAKDDPLSAERVQAASEWIDRMSTLPSIPPVRKTLRTVRALADAHLAATTPRPLSEWHEDIGPVLWWAFPVDEEPYCGSPLNADWPTYHTHWTPITVPAPPPA